MKKHYSTLLLDLDGTVYAGDAEVPGAGDFIRRCAAHHIRCLFVTNRSNRTRETIVSQLTSYGIPCTVEQIITTATATASYLKTGSAYVIGEEGLEIALQEQGIQLTDQAPDAVVVSFDRGFTYDKLKTACFLIGQGSRFIATNTDACLKQKDGVLPGTGSIVAAVQTGCGKAPVVIGKPEAILYEIALASIGASLSETLAVGDNLATDILAATHCKMDSAFILTGVNTREDLLKPGSPTPTYIVEDYSALSQIVF